MNSNPLVCPCESRWLWILYEIICFTCIIMQDDRRCSAPKVWHSSTSIQPLRPQPTDFLKMASGSFQNMFVPKLLKDCRLPATASDCQRLPATASDFTNVNSSRPCQASSTIPTKTCRDHMRSPIMLPPTATMAVNGKMFGKSQNVFLAEVKMVCQGLLSSTVVLIQTQRASLIPCSVDTPMKSS